MVAALFVAAQYTPPSGGGGAAVWGSITGTLSSQSDLNSALGGKVPTTTTVAGHALSSNVTVACGDLSNAGNGCTGTIPTTLNVDEYLPITMPYAASGPASGGWGPWSTPLITNEFNFENSSSVVTPILRMPTNSSNVYNVNWHVPGTLTAFTSVTIEGEEVGFTASTSPTFQVAIGCPTNIQSITLNSATTTGGTFSAAGTGGLLHAVTFHVAHHHRVLGGQEN